MSDKISLHPKETNQNHTHIMNNTNPISKTEIQLSFLGRLILLFYCSLPAFKEALDVIH